MSTKKLFAVITGAATGLGRAFAEQLCSEGWHCAILDIDAAAARECAAALETYGGAANWAACDVSDSEAFLACLQQQWDEYGPFDLLINNAGVMGHGRLADVDLVDLQWQMSINVAAPWLATRFYYQKLKDIEGDLRGRVINISSEHGICTPHVDAGFYTATKHALFGLSDVMAEEMADRLDLTIACPGIVATNLWNAGQKRPEQFGGAQDSPKALKAIQSQGMDATEVAEIILQASQDRSRYVLTHGHLAAEVAGRAQALTQAAEKYAPRDQGERYAVSTIVQELKRGRGSFDTS